MGHAGCFALKTQCDKNSSDKIPAPHEDSNCVGSDVLRVGGKKCGIYDMRQSCLSERRWKPQLEPFWVEAAS